MTIRVTACGVRGSYPAYGDEYRIYGKETSCYVIRENDYAIVLDCGTGLVHAKEVIIGCRRVDVLFSHIHYDHIMGLLENPDFVSKAEVRFFGEFLEWEKLEKKNGTLFHIEDYVHGTRTSIPLGVPIALSDGFNVVFTRANHGDYATMMKIEMNGHVICYTGDNDFDYSEEMSKWADNADLLLCEGSYTQEEKVRFSAHGHSSWDDGVKMAENHNVGKLVIVHHGYFHTDKIIKEEEEKAKKVYPDIIFARQGDSWKIG